MANDPKNTPKGFDSAVITSTLISARTLAAQMRHEYVTVDHVLAVLLGDQDVLDFLAKENINNLELAAHLSSVINDTNIDIGRNYVDSVETNALNDMVQILVVQSLFSGRSMCTSMDMLLAIAAQSEDESNGAAILKHYNVTSLSIKKYLAAIRSEPENTSAAPKTTRKVVGPDGEPVLQEATTEEEARDFLKKFTQNLNEVAADGKIDSVIGREDEIQDLVHVIARRTKNNVVMVGEPGVGKTAIAEGLALKIVRGEVPDVIKNSTVFSLNIGDLVAGTRFRGDFEERIKLVLKALTFMKEPILFIDEIHMIMGAGAGKENSMDVANLLKPALAKGQLRCIGSTTFEEYRKTFDKDRALQRRFEKLDINEPDVASAKLIMRGLRASYEQHHGVSYTDEALDQAVELTSRFVQNKFLPDKAIDIIDRAGARQRVKAPADRATSITADHIMFEVARVAKIPEQTVGTDERSKLIALEGALKTAVYGQDAAIDTLVDAVVIARAGLRDDNKPAGSFLFVGPTGVGKTETARQLADSLGVPLVKFDMSEYAEKHSVAKLIGAPPGYVGHGEGGAGSGMLTNEIENKPHCVLLLDEVEKAHPDIFNTFLQVMDDGRLTNSSGKTVYFNNVTLIMTSNAGAREASKNTLGFTGPAHREGAGDKIVNETFTPEFRNRLDAVVKFNGLGKELLVKVVTKFTNRIAKQLAAREMTLVITDEAIEWLANQDVDPAMGARPVERVVAEHVKKPVSKAIIFQDAKKGGTVTVTKGENALVVTVA